MPAHFRMTEAQERDLSMVHASLGAVSDMLDATSRQQYTLDPEQVAALLTLLRERLPSPETMPFVVE